MEKQIRIKEKFNHDDTCSGFRGILTFGQNRIQKEYIDPYDGCTKYYNDFEIIHYQAENIVPIGGYQFAFNKLFNIGLDQESNLRVGDLNDEAPQMRIGVSRAQYQSIHFNAETSVTNPSVVTNPGINISANNFIFGFMMGDGGAREDNMTAIAPDYKRRGLFRAIPFRMDNDGTNIPQGRYCGKATTFTGSTEMEPVSSYFVKRFDTPPPRIIHIWVTDNPNELSLVDDTVFASTSSIPIESYVEMNMSVSDEDGRGFFTTTGASPRINEFGLVSGWFNPQLNDYESIRLFTHFTRPSIALSEGDSIEIIYRLYAR